jgi:hypothetical protein
MEARIDWDNYGSKCAECGKLVAAYIAKISGGTPSAESDCSALNGGGK